MRPAAADAVVRIAALTAIADGTQDEAERTQLVDVADRLGVSLDEVLLVTATSAPIEATRLARVFESDEERALAYRTALAVANADGYVNTRETLFLRSLAQALGVDGDGLAREAESTARDVDAWVGASAATASGATAAGTSSGGASESLDDFILDQAMLTAALELLPDKLANLAIIPLQMRLVHTIGQRRGASTDGGQIKALMATLGVGVVAQALETAVRKTFGGLAGGLLGRMLGGAGGVAAGAAVTFASTYALGHVAERYYAQGQSLSGADLKSLFGKFRGEADTLYPRVQQRIAGLAQGNTLASIMQSVRGELRST
jgi:tellurite resistance protein/uncharacterized protein (DUF697 family)